MGAAPRRPEGHGLRLAESLIVGVGTTGRIAVHSTARGTTATLSMPLLYPRHSPARALNQAAT